MFEPALFAIIPRMFGSRAHCPVRFRTCQRFLRLRSSSTLIVFYITTAGCNFPRRVKAHGSMHSNASCLLWVPLSPYLDCSKRGGVFKKDLFGPLRGPLRPWPSINRMLVSFVGEFWVSPPLSRLLWRGGEKSWGKFYQFPGPLWAILPP